MPKFRVQWAVVAEIEVDEAVLDAVDDEWREVLYQLHTAEDIAEHIAYNLVANQSSLSMLDGWADQPDDNARLVDQDWETIDVVELEPTDA